MGILYWRQHGGTLILPNYVTNQIPYWQHWGHMFPRSPSIHQQYLPHLIVLRCSLSDSFLPSASFHLGSPITSLSPPSLALLYLTLPSPSRPFFIYSLPLLLLLFSPSRTLILSLSFLPFPDQSSSNFSPSRLFTSHTVPCHIPPSVPHSSPPWLPIISHSLPITSHSWLLTSPTLPILAWS